MVLNRFLSIFTGNNILIQQKSCMEYSGLVYCFCSLLNENNYYIEHVKWLASIEIIINFTYHISTISVVV